MADKTNDQYIYKLISNNIKRFRALQNISQLGLAVKTGLTHNFINDIENCKKGVSIKTLAKLSEALDAEPYQFFLTETMYNDDMALYVKDFNDSLNKMVAGLSQKYLSKDNQRTSP